MNRRPVWVQTPGTLRILPVPLPDAAHVLLERPSAPETELTARGVASAVGPAGRLTELQRVLLEAVFVSMTGHPVDLAAVDPMTPEELGRHLARRNLAFRTRCVQIMLLAAFVLRPLPEEVVDRVSAYAAELGVDDGMITVAREFAAGSLGLAGVDFQRNGYTSEWHSDAASVLHTSKELDDAWQTAVDDPDLAARWSALERLPEATLGHQVTRLYRARGFEYPGLAGSAPPLLAQHDWVHVLADYGTTVESELEVFGLIARANDDMRGFSLLAMVISLFETGYMSTGAGLFQADAGHLSHDPRVAPRIADAMYRGAECRDGRTGSSSVDFLEVDWFELADRPVTEVREIFGLPPKSEVAREAGSAGPWERGGISPFQLGMGRRMAEERGVPYDSYGADVGG